MSTVRPPWSRNPSARDIQWQCHDPASDLTRLCALITRAVSPTIGRARSTLHAAAQPSDHVCTGLHQEFDRKQSIGPHATGICELVWVDRILCGGARRHWGPKGRNRGARRVRSSRPMRRLPHPDSCGSQYCFAVAIARIGRMVSTTIKRFSGLRVDARERSRGCRARPPILNLTGRPMRCSHGNNRPVIARPHARAPAPSASDGELMMQPFRLPRTPSQTMTKSSRF